MPEGNPRRLVMPKPSEGARVIHQLRVAQTTARGDQAQQVAFLLAVFGSDYQRNRDYLLWVLKGCEVPEIKHGCNDMTGEYLFYLYEQGHPDILAPLLNSSVKSHSAAGAESLGELFADLVVKSPKDFLGAVRLFPPSTQRKMCYFAGTAGDGGMAPADLKKVRKQLGAMNDETAQRCLREIEEANKPEQK